MSDETELTIVHGQAAEEESNAEAAVELSQGDYIDIHQDDAPTEAQPETEATPPLADLPGMQESYPLPTPEIGKMTPPAPPEIGKTDKK